MVTPTPADTATEFRQGLDAADLPLGLNVVGEIAAPAK